MTLVVSESATKDGNVEKIASNSLTHTYDTGGQTMLQQQGNLPWQAPAKQGLYDPYYEHDACGVGFIVNIDGKRSNKVY